MRIVIVEDHAMFREALHSFSDELGHRVVGEAGTGRKAKHVISETRPDLVMLDVHLPEGDGFEVAEYTRLGWPKIKILMLSAHCDDYTLYRAERSGVHGFVEKNSQTTRALRDAIRTIERGGSYFSTAYREAQTARAKQPDNFSKILSERECAILTKIGGMKLNEEIADELNISVSTVETHRSNIMRKLKISNTTNLIRYALEHGFSRVVSRRNDKRVYF